MRMVMLSLLLVVPLVAQSTASTVSATITVNEGHSIQAAIDRAQAGDRVEIMPGTYHETLTVGKAGITIVGVKQEGARAVLDGKGELPDAVRVSGDNVTIEGLSIRNYLGNGVVANKGRNVVVRDLNVHDTGKYGVSPVECDNVLIERCVVSGMNGAAIHVGQSREIVVRNNETYYNAAGIQIQNCVNALVENNSSHNNRTGMLVVVLPDNSSNVGEHCRIVNNRFIANNGGDFGEPSTMGSALSPGVGLMVVAADHTEITQNTIQDNDALGIAVLSLLSAPLPVDRAHEFDIEPNSDHTWIHGNTYLNNGATPSAQFKKDFQNVPGVDLFWDGTGTKNQWQEPNTLKTFPPDLIEKQGGVHTNVIEFH